MIELYKVIFRPRLPVADLILSDGILLNAVPLNIK